MSDRNDDLSSDPFQELFEERRRRMEQHNALRDSETFRGAVKHLDRLAYEYRLALAAINMMATRNPPFFEGLITLRVTPQLNQSMVAAIWMVKDGALDPAKRELRFLLEASVKSLWLDSGGPHIDATGFEGANYETPYDVKAKVKSLDTLGRNRFGNIVASLKFGLLDEQSAQTYRDTAKDLYSNLSSFIHMGSGNVARHLKNSERNHGIGFESVADVNAITNFAKRVLDLALASHFEAFDASLVGDILVRIFDDRARWAFRKTPLVGAIDRHFNYKTERNCV